MEKESKKYRLIGIELLRILMIYCVILHHISPEYSFVTSKLSKIDVYVFAAIAFFFIDATLEDINKKYIQRLKRLIIPLWGWSIFYYIVYGIRKDGVGILLFQMLTGVSDYNPTLWFLANQIYLITIFCILKKTIKLDKAYWMTMIVFSIMCILIKSRVQFIYDDFYLRNTIGRIIEIFPLVIVGKLAKMIQLKLQQYENYVIHFVLLILESMTFAGIFVFTEINEVEKLAISFCLLMIFNSKILGKGLNNFKHKIIVTNISKYTLGVYCIHVIILNFFRKMGIKFIDIYIHAIVVYIICVIICAVISKIKKLRVLVQ